MTHLGSSYRLVACVLLCLFPAVSAATDKKPTPRQDRHEIVRIMAGELLAGLNPKTEISKPKSTTLPTSGETKFENSTAVSETAAARGEADGETEDGLWKGRSDLVERIV